MVAQDAEHLVPAVRMGHEPKALAASIGRRERVDVDLCRVPDITVPLFPPPPEQGVSAASQGKLTRESKARGGLCNGFVLPLSRGSNSPLTVEVGGPKRTGP
jgi:hypothetical protein